MSAPISIQKISREQVEIPKPKNHPFNQTFQTACESFSGQGINIVSGRGFGQVLDDAAAYESYKDAMFGDIQNEDVKLALETVMENDRSVIDGAVGGNIAMEDGSVAKDEHLTFTQAFNNVILDQAETNPKITAITAAMAQVDASMGLIPRWGLAPCACLPLIRARNWQPAE